MTIHLSGLGWVNDVPEGNRLRWSYPYDELDAAGAYVGLPVAMVIERAPIRADMMWQTGRSRDRWASDFTPVNWWESLGDITLPLFGDPIPLPGPVQGVRLVYRGIAARLIARDSGTGRMVADRIVSDGDVVRIDASSVDELQVLAFGGTLEDVRVLDLFRDRPELDFQRVAEISTAASYSAALAAVEGRYAAPSTMTKAEWAELCDVVAQATASAPGSWPDPQSSPWQALRTVLGVRWEYAALGGFGYVDGPVPDTSPLDRVDPGAALSALPTVAMVYRVVDSSGAAGRSNVVVCPAFAAATLAGCGAPSYDRAGVRLRADDIFEGTWRLAWSGADAGALGVLVTEEVGASASAGAPGYTRSYQQRSTSAGHAPGAGDVVRVDAVSSYDVVVRGRVSAVDAWDRESVPSAWSQWVPLSLEHSPPAPPLFSAVRAGSAVVLHRAVHDPVPGHWQPQVPDWEPDLIARRSMATVVTYRRTASPTTARVTVTAPYPQADGSYSVRVVTPTAYNAGVFAGGLLMAGGLQLRITSVGAPGPGGTVLVFRPVTDGAFNPLLFSAGAATLAQDGADLALWTPVASFPATALPVDLSFSDPMPPVVGAARVVSYAARVHFLGRLGPLSNIVQAVDIPPTPVVPPPFTVTMLGLDFYHRTLVRIDLTTSSPTGRFTVASTPGWSGDWSPGENFAQRCTPGEYGAQQPHDGIAVYEVLSLPGPARVEQHVTIGLQQVNSAGGQSDFATVAVTIPAV